MATYIIHELQNLESVSQGEVYTGTLRGAKAKASRQQSWVGTTLKITDEAGKVVSTKGPQARGWYDRDEWA